MYERFFLINMQRCEYILDICIVYIAGGKEVLILEGRSQIYKLIIKKIKYTLIYSISNACKLNKPVKLGSK